MKNRSLNNPSRLKTPLKTLIIKYKRNTLSDYSTVTDCFLNVVNVPKGLTMKELNELYLFFTISIYSTNLTNIHHYNSQQQLLYDEVKYLKEVMNLGYKKISKVLRDKGYKSVRSNKDLLPNYIYSIYKKGKIREDRLNKEFDDYYFDIILFNP